MADTGHEERGSYRDPVVIEQIGPATAVVNGRAVDVYILHDYLGLSRRAEVCRAAAQSFDRFGLNLCAVRPQGGCTPEHRQLERELAAFIGKEDAVVFASGWQATGAALQALVRSAVETSLSPENVLLCADEAVLPDLLHQARGQKVTVREFAHNNLWGVHKAILSRKLEQRVIFTYGVYSMCADVTPLDKYLDLAQETNATVLMDDAHGIGTLGDRLGGVADHFGVMHHPRLVISGSFSKAFGGSGGFVTGSTDFCRRLRNFASGYLHAQPLAPAMAAGLLAALQILREDGRELQETLRRNIATARSSLKAAGLAVQGANAIPCITAAVGDDELARQIRDEMLAEGVLVSALTWPMLAAGNARLRMLITAAHSREQINHLAATLAQAAARNRLRLDLPGDASA